MMPLSDGPWRTGLQRRSTDDTLQDLTTSLEKRRKIAELERAVAVTETELARARHTLSNLQAQEPWPTLVSDQKNGSAGPASSAPPVSSALTKSISVLAGTLPQSGTGALALDVGPHFGNCECSWKNTGGLGRIGTAGSCYHPCSSTEYGPQHHSNRPRCCCHQERESCLLYTSPSPRD